MSDESPRIQVRRNGPLLVTGDVELIDWNGDPIPLPDGVPGRYKLCRCGESAEKPFCDAAHKQCDFKPDPED